MHFSSHILSHCESIQKVTHVQIQHHKIPSKSNYKTNCWWWECIFSDISKKKCIGNVRRRKKCDGRNYTNVGKEKYNVWSKIWKKVQFRDSMLFASTTGFFEKYSLEVLSKLFIALFLAHCIAGILRNEPYECGLLWAQKK